MKRYTIAFALALLLALGLAGQALAHAKLASSTPAAGVKLTAAPASVTLKFDEEISEQESHFSVTNASKTVVGTGKLDLNDLDHKTLTAALASGLGDGVYVVTWKTVTTDDNGVSQGTFIFGVNADPGSQPVAPEAPEAATTIAATAAPKAVAAQPTAATKPTAAVADGAQPTAISPTTLPRTAGEPSPVLLLIFIAIVVAAIGLTIRQIRDRRR